MRKLVPILTIFALIGYAIYDNINTHQKVNTLITKDSLETNEFVDSLEESVFEVMEKVMEKERQTVMLKDSLDSVKTITEKQNQLLWEENSRLKVQKESLDHHYKERVKRSKLRNIKPMEVHRVTKIPVDSGHYRVK